MCGITCIISKENSDISEEILVSTNDLISHRGPDGEGFYYGENFAFGHRRLAILDLSPDGHQPMHWKDKYVITFNGEIFNYIEIRSDLIQQGYTFHSQSDTEVILAAYDCWGEDCVKQFNGMWSFVLYDKAKNLLFCSRDRFGIKPFYIFEDDEKLVFGSEIKQLLPFLKKRKVNQQVLLEYLITGAEEFSNYTFFKGITKLEQAHNLVYDLSNHTKSISQYYDIEIDRDRRFISQETAVELYSRQLKDAVTIRMRSDVEVGTCLSGGLDSSTITAMAASLASESGKTIKAIHAKATEKRLDESFYAEMVAKHTDSELNTLEPTVEDFKNVVDTVVAVQEEPFGSPSIVLQYLVLQKARELNCIVMLDGQGGDETLLGYSRYYPAYLLEQKGFVAKWKGFMKSSSNSGLSRKEMLTYYLYFTNYPLRMWYLKRRSSFIKKEVLNNFKSEILKEITSTYTDLISLQRLEIKKTQLPHLLKYEDKNSTANSVETRLPFLDYRCVELAVSLPNQYKIKEGWTKNILRNAVNEILPKEVAWRKDKLGFAAPEKTWLDNHLEEMQRVINQSSILDLVLDKEKFNLRKLDLKTKWKLFNIAKWEELFEVEW